MGYGVRSIYQGFSITLVELNSFFFRHNPEKLIVSKYVNRKIKIKCAKQRERDLMLLHCVLVL